MKILLSVFSIFISISFATAQELTAPDESRIGISFLYAQRLNHILDTNPSRKTISHELELGAYHEKRPFRQNLLFTLGAYLRYKEDLLIFTDNEIKTINSELTTTFIEHNHELDATQVKIVLPLEVRFYPIDSKNVHLYLFAGLGFHYDLLKKEKTKYLFSAYFDRSLLMDVEKIRNDVPTLPATIPQRFGYNFDFGFGLEWKKTSLEIISRLDTDELPAIGLRLRRQLGLKIIE